MTPDYGQHAEGRVSIHTSACCPCTEEPAALVLPPLPYREIKPISSPDRRPDRFRDPDREKTTFFLRRGPPPPPRQNKSPPPPHTTASIARPPEHKPRT